MSKELNEALKPIALEIANEAAEYFEHIKRIENLMFEAISMPEMPPPNLQDYESIKGVANKFLLPKKQNPK